MVKVSVVIPVYNGEKTIKRCIDSVLNQTLEEIEIIVVNDGSSDGTMDILGEYGNRINVITIENSGQGNARNIGIDNSSGEYIGFVDADDTIDKKMYEVMYHAANEFSADMAQCAINDILDNTQIIRSGIDKNVEVKNTDRYVKKYFYTLIHTNEVCNKIFKREFLNNNKLIFLDTIQVYSEDLAFNIESLKYIKRISFISLPLYNYYITETGHCKKNPVDRIIKIWYLYKNACENINGVYNRKAIMSMAVINTLIYSVDIVDEKYVRAIISSSEFKKYCVASICFKKSLNHSILMLIVIIFPYELKKWIIKKYFKF